MDPDLHRRLPNASQLILANIAQGAPLVQTLTSIVHGIEDQHHEISAAIFLLDEDGNQLRVDAAPSLHQAYRRAMDNAATNLGLWTRQLVADHKAEQIETGRFWGGFRDLALQHGLHACAAVPI